MFVQQVVQISSGFTSKSIKNLQLVDSKTRNSEFQRSRVEGSKELQGNLQGHAKKLHKYEHHLIQKRLELAVCI